MASRHEPIARRTGRGVESGIANPSPTGSYVARMQRMPGPAVASTEMGGPTLRAASADRGQGAIRRHREPRPDDPTLVRGVANSRFPNGPHPHGSLRPKPMHGRPCRTPPASTAASARLIHCLVHARLRSRTLGRREAKVVAKQMVGSWRPGPCEWRRGRDSNPRDGFKPPTPLAGERLRPLGHLSKNGPSRNGAVRSRGACDAATPLSAGRGMAAADRGAQRDASRPRRWSRFGHAMFQARRSGLARATVRPCRSVPPFRPCRDALGQDASLDTRFDRMFGTAPSVPAVSAPANRFGWSAS